MKRHSVRVAFAAVLLVGIGAVVSAAQAQQGTINVPPEEAKAYQPIEAAATPADAITQAKAFIAKYPKSAALPQVEIALYKKIVDSPKDDTRVANTAAYKAMYPTSDYGVELDRSLADYYLSKENFAEVKRVSEAFLVKHPDDASSHFLLLQIGVQGAKAGDASLVQAGIEHGKKAIELLEAPTKPEAFSTDAEWTAYKTETLPSAYQAYGILAVATNNVAVAQDYLAKATAAKPTDPLNYLFLASIKEGEYEPLAKAYNAALDKTSDAAKKKLEAVNVVVDQLIPLYAKAVVYSEGNAQYAAMNASARQSLEGYYKLRHDGKLDGLDKVLADAKAAK